MKGYFHKRGEKWAFTLDIGIDSNVRQKKTKK